ncbi:hypothetical protein [Bacillus sp. FJAT-27225]|uniref:hypothetical protein n=1 Tax=Bacillus sp. FJAT-27225 TaxID=1743144 RepID=UPI001586E79C|nr:hypothetical protein [Bacillus sp. FJAT-27225]
MTLIHILNYTIPITFMIFLGFWLDRLLKPVPTEADGTSEHQELLKIDTPEEQGTS